MEPSRGGEANRRSRASYPCCSSPRIGEIITVDVFFFIVFVFSETFLFFFFFFSPLVAPRPSSSVIYGEQELWMGRLGSGESESGWR